MKRVHVVVTGLVQGVSFRSFTKQSADRLKITGWVRNLPDGSVEAVAEGGEKALEEFLASIKTGPPKAKVERVTFEYSGAKGEFSGFEVTA